MHSNCILNTNRLFIYLIKLQVNVQQQEHIISYFITILINQNTNACMLKKISMHKHESINVNFVFQHQKFRSL